MQYIGEELRYVIEHYKITCAVDIDIYFTSTLDK